MALVEFLRARLAEDMEVAIGGAPSPWREGGWDGEFEGPREVLDKHGDVTATVYYGGTYGHVLRFDPTRVLRDIEAKQRIIEDYEVLRADYRVTHDPTTEARRFQALVAIGRLAAAYSSHPDYDETWRP